MSEKQALKETFDELLKRRADGTQPGTGKLIKAIAIVMEGFEERISALETENEGLRDEKNTGSDYEIRAREDRKIAERFDADRISKHGGTVIDVDRFHYFDCWGTPHRPGFRVHECCPNYTSPEHSGRLIDELKIDVDYEINSGFWVATKRVGSTHFSVHLAGRREAVRALLLEIEASGVRLDEEETEESSEEEPGAMSQAELILAENALAERGATGFSAQFDMGPGAEISANALPPTRSDKFYEAMAQKFARQESAWRTKLPRPIPPHPGRKR